jgi:hypothetical protein
LEKEEVRADKEDQGWNTRKDWEDLRERKTE